MTPLFGFSHRAANFGWGLFLFVVGALAAVGDFVYSDDDMAGGFAAILIALTGLILFLDGFSARKGQAEAKGLLDTASWLLLGGILVFLFFG